MSTEEAFIEYSTRKLNQLCERIEICVSKLTPEQIWSRRAENENAIGNLMLHLEGNVRQWILSGVDGEADIRVRNREFSTRSGVPVTELKARLRSTVDRAIEVIRTLPPARLTERITVQGYDITVLEAIYSVVEHFSGHTFQVIFVTKLLTGEDLGFYSYLSAPKAHEAETP
jgi:hypothetical protein